MTLIFSLHPQLYSNNSARSPNYNNITWFSYTSNGKPRRVNLVTLEKFNVAMKNMLRYCVSRQSKPLQRVGGQWRYRVLSDVIKNYVIMFSPSLLLRGLCELASYMPRVQHSCPAYSASTSTTVHLDYATLCIYYVILQECFVVALLIPSS